MIHIIEEIFTRRNLIQELVLKDLKMRYSKPALGFFWILLSPLLLVAIFYLVFSVFLQVKTKEAPFVLYLMSAIFPWRFFQDSLLSCATSLIDNKNIIRESKFPHYFIPLSIVLVNGINFLPSLSILIITSFFVLKGLPAFIVFLPFILIIHFMLTIGLSLIVSVLYVKLRDIKYILEALLTILFYLTPVFYSPYLVKDCLTSFWFRLYISNPFVGMLNLYRIAILKDFYRLIKADFGLVTLFFIPIAFAFFIILLGFNFYKKNKDSINDYLSY